MKIKSFCPSSRRRSVARRRLRHGRPLRPDRGSENVVTVGAINIQDYLQAANAMTGELLAAGALDRVPTPPAVLAISRIVNNTGSQIDTDLLTKKSASPCSRAARL